MLVLAPSGPPASVADRAGFIDKMRGLNPRGLGFTAQFFGFLNP